MAEIISSVNIEFKDTKSEKQKFNKLLQLMDKAETGEEFDFDECNYCADDIVQNALLGKLEDRGEDSEYFCEFFPDFDLTLAPKLFAYLFPNSNFTHKIQWENSTGGGISALEANYSNNKLLIKQCNSEDDLEELDDDSIEEYEDGELSDEDIIEMIMDNISSKEYKPEYNESYINSFYSGNNLINELSNDEEDFDDDD